MSVEIFTKASVPTSASIDVTVREDTDQDGTIENTESVTIADGVELNTLTSLSGGTGNDYDLSVDYASGSAATLETVELETEPTSNTVKLVTDADIPSGASMTVRVYEDLNQDGDPTSFETVTITNGTTSNTLSTLQGGTGVDYDLSVDYTPGSSATLNSAKLEIDSTSSTLQSIGNIADINF